VTGYHRSIEQLNRLFTGVVSVAIILAVLGSLARVPRRRDLVGWSLGLVGGLIGQIVLGGITVIFDLWPPLVMGHFVLSAILVWDAAVLYDRAGRPDGPARADGRARDAEAGTSIVDPRLRTLARAMVALGAVLLVTGTVVTGTGPHGGDERVRRLPFQVEDVARIHSLTAWAFLVVAVVTLWLVHRSGATPTLDRRGLVLVGAILVQGAIGYTQYFTGLPAGLVWVHVSGSLLIWIAALRLMFAVRDRGPLVQPPPESPGGPAASSLPEAQPAPAR
jgi:cytochrome c oxidase assembly protein subunit 15